MAANYQKLKMYKIVYRVEILGTGCVVRPNPNCTTNTSSTFDPKINFLVSHVRHDLPPFLKKFIIGFVRFFVMNYSNELRSKESSRKSHKFVFTWRRSYIDWQVADSHCFRCFRKHRSFTLFILCEFIFEL